MAQKNKGYALALFSLANDLNIAKKVFFELQEITDVLYSTPEYIEFLCSPAVSKEAKIKSLNKVIPQNYSDELKSFLIILCKKGDINEIFECLEEYKSLYNDMYKLSVANVVSAVELDEKVLARIKNALEVKTGKKLTLKTTVNKEILGGITVEIDGCVYDGSLRRKLGEIKKVIE